MDLVPTFIDIHIEFSCTLVLINIIFIRLFILISLAIVIYKIDYGPNEENAVNYLFENF